MSKLKKIATEELLNELKTRKSPEMQKQIKDREKYEAQREKTISTLFKEAIKNNELLKAFHTKCVVEMDAQYERLQSYGEIRANSKGGFSIMSADGTKKISYKYVSFGKFDERANKAADLLKDFLQDFVKKKDAKVYNIVMSLLEKNKEGDFEYSRINSLYKYENEFDDMRWQEAIKLFKESFVRAESKMQLYFQQKNESGIFETINLNFSTL
jgi:hypothetical protein